MSVLPVGFGSALGGYQIERSLRFNSADSAYLNRTPASAGNRKTWTWSGWVKRGKLGATQWLFDADNGSTDSTELNFAIGSGDTLSIGGSLTTWRVTTQVFRDPSAWYHIVLAVDTTQATANNRIKFYVNGSEITAFSTLNNPTQNLDLAVNQAIAHYIGIRTGLTSPLDGYLTEINFVDSPVLVGSTTNASTTVTLTTGTTTNIGIGWNVGGTNIPSGATVSSITSSTQFVISSAATGTGSSINIGVTPPVSAFGETDASTGVWKPKKYDGTYGTNGFYLPFKTASQWSGYFDGTGDYLSFNGSTGTTLSGDFTVESWVYLPSVTTTAPIMCIGDSFSSPGILFYVNSSSKIAIARANTVAFTGSTSLVANTWNHVAFVRSGSTITGYLNGVSQGTFTNSSTFSGTTTVIGREVYNSGVGGQLTGYISNLRIVNGTAVYTGTFTPPTSQLTAITNTSLLTCQSSTFVDNSTNAFTITAFGDARPQQFSPFTLDVTDDHSGTGNNWIPNNLDLRTTGTGADILVDSPTSYGTDTGVGGEVRGNYCTLNGTSIGANATLSNGNLDISYGSSATRNATMGTFGMSSGKWYWETTIVSLGTPSIGITNTPSPSDVSNYPGFAANGWSYLSDGTKYNSGTGVAYGATYTTNDVIGVAFDADTRELTFYKNGVSQGVAYTGLAVNTYFPAFGDGSAAGTWSGSTNFGQRPFQKWNGSAYVANTAPSGFKALCTQNFTTPTIGATSTTQADNYFDVGLVAGSASVDQTITTAFAPDFYWSKNRNSTIDHGLYNTIAGGNKYLSSNATTTETTTTASVVTFNSTGVSLKAGGSIINDATRTYVGWLWRGGGTGSTNSNGTAKSSSVTVDSGTDTVTWNSHGMSDGQKIGFFAATMPGGLSAGTLYYVRDAATNTFKVAASSGGAAIDITSNGTTVTAHTTLTSTVSASATSGFSIVTYTGSGANATVEHGLGVAPSMLIAKVRSSAGDDWTVYHTSIGATNRVMLNLTNASAASTVWNNTAPTSSVFSVGTIGDTNRLNATIVAYCFAPVAGYSAFGSYTGNGSTDGPFVYTGFRPRYILIKRTDSADNWAVYDTARDEYNQATKQLRPDAATAQLDPAGSPAVYYDFLSNGFKNRGSNSQCNANGGIYIYAAFAEHPFKYSLAR